jgi:dephospho-CoA kinase
MSTAFWGLTGGAASGKTTIAGFFTELGLPVLDADGVSHRLSAPGGAAHDEIVKLFGTADRGKLREIVFQDPSARQKLEKILHPLIARESALEMQRLADETGAPVVIYEATLLIETGRHQSLSGLIVVESPLKQRKIRLLARSGVTETIAEGILKSQLSDEERRKAASILIENNGSLDELRSKVREISLAAGWISS